MADANHASEAIQNPIKSLCSLKEMLSDGVNKRDIENSNEPRLAVIVSHFHAERRTKQKAISVITIVFIFIIMKLISLSGQ
jgi:hypothetical protein